MPLIVIGFNHKTTPLSLRERLALAPSQLKTALSDLLKGIPHAKEAMLLSTCQRTEYYLYSNLPFDLETFTRWQTHYCGLLETELTPHRYVYEEQAVARHLMRVANGLDSSLLGEAQILGQLKQAYHLAKQAGSLGKHLEQLLQLTFSTAKQVRAKTSINEGSVSLAYTAVSLGKCIFSALPRPNVLLIGAGDVIQSTLKHVQKKAGAKITLANRSLEKAQALAKTCNGQAISLTDIPIYLKKADVVITATASETPIITQSLVMQASETRQHLPLFIVDMAMPRDVEASVGDIEGISLYNIDDLHRIIQTNLTTRASAIEKADKIIHAQTQRLMQLKQLGLVAPAICALQAKFKQLEQHTLHLALNQLSDKTANPETILKNTLQCLVDQSYCDKKEVFKRLVLSSALRQLQLGRAMEEVLPKAMHQLTRKLLHSPMLSLRSSALEKITAN